MKKLRGFLCGFLVASIMITCVPTLAESIQAVFNAMIINVNGTTVNQKGQNYTLSNGDKVPYSIVYKGTTYLPLRKLVELLDKDLTLDGATSTVYINDKVLPKPTPTPTPPLDDSSSRKNPAKINENIYMTSTEGKNSFDSTITLKELIRGDDAWEKIYNANKYNDIPENGYEYILAKFSLKVNIASNDNIQFDLNKYNFKLVSEDGKDYDLWSCVLPEPSIDAMLYSGASHEGWVAFKVKTTDLKPLIVYGKSYDGSGGVWFTGYNNSNSSTSTSTPTTTHTAPTNSSTAKITTASELKTYLEENYSQLSTSKGMTKFTFDILENKSIMSPYDYWIQVEYDSNFFYNLEYSVDWTNKERTEVKKELKDFMEELGKDITNKMPDKKLFGGYFDSWYRYPNLKVDLITRMYYSWTNYDEPEIFSETSDYEQTKPSTFRWDSSIDDEL